MASPPSPSSSKPPRLLAVMGPTGSGKSDLAEAVAEAWNAALLNADAFQAYRRFDIGTGKPDARARYDLLDFKNPTEAYGVGEFVRLALPLLETAFAADRDVVIVGGTGFYIRALLESYDGLAPEPDPRLRARLMADERELGLPALVARLPAEVAARTDLQNPVRVRRALERLAGPPPETFVLPRFEIEKFALVPEDSRERIERRVGAMFAAGWAEEVRELVRDVPLDAPAFRAIGYRRIATALQGGESLQNVHEEVTLETIRYAKRQRTWTRSEPRLQTWTGDGAGALQTLLTRRRD
ncbi:tRNA (adenosine(37)-N6)-dimethylallyltransferase MiaA [bacterium]|nr:MAG: tRNA (adenosine(37)-N6)-dimethylallyltransferase MiaA [bacterium]